MSAHYDVLDLKYKDGRTAVLRHVDGSGFVYYPSGRKAICISAHGCDGKGRVRRFGAIIHDDSPRSDVLGAFDEWGRGSTEGQQSSSDANAPRLMITEKALTIIDGSGKVSEVPLASALGPRAPTSPRGPQPEVTLRVNSCIVLQHHLGRITLDFRSEGISHSMLVGELQGDEVAGMPKPGSTMLSPESAQQLKETTLKLSGVCEKISTFKVDPSQKDTKIPVTTLQDVLANITLLPKSLAHPNLAPPEIQWSTEGRLKKLLSHFHPQCPGQDRKNWTIARVSGKCTVERLANAKPTVATPKSIAMVSQLKLPELIDETSSKSTLLVVICLAAYAKEQSSYARLLAERAHAELWKRFQKSDSAPPPPVRLVGIELTEIAGFEEQYGIREPPYCLMFSGGKRVYGKRLRGMRDAPRDANMTRPRVLLVEPNPAQQLKLERNLRRSGFSSDLAFDGQQAARLAARELPYGVLLVSSLLPLEPLRLAAAAVRRQEPSALLMAFDAGVPGASEDPEERRRFLDECNFVFPYAPSYTGLAAILARFEVTAKMSAMPVTTQKQDFLDEILAMIQGGQTVAA